MTHGVLHPISIPHVGTSSCAGSAGKIILLGQTSLLRCVTMVVAAVGVIIIVIVTIMMMEDGDDDDDGADVDYRIIVVLGFYPKPWHWLLRGTLGCQREGSWHLPESRNARLRASSLRGG